MNPNDFAALIGGLISCTGHTMAKRDIEIWRRHLADLPDDSLRAAFERACAECKAFPSVALIREYAAVYQNGDLRPNADVWPRVLKAVKHFGIYGNAQAREAIPALVWRAIGGDQGWEHLCDMESDQRTVFAAQFRDRYRELAAQEQKARLLPEHLRPRLNDEQTPALPPLTEPGLKLLTEAAAGLKSIEDEQKRPALRSVIRRTKA